MNFKSLFLRLERSKEFSEFKEKNPEAFLCAGFFIRDYKDGNNQSSVDFANNGKITTFTPSENSFQIKEEEILDKTRPLSQFSPDIKIDIDQLKELVEKELQKNNINGSLEKIIAVLQANPAGGDAMWNLTCFVEGMKIILVHIDATTQEILKFENRSLFDFVRPQKA